MINITVQQLKMNMEAYKLNKNMIYHKYKIQIKYLL